MTTTSCPIPLDHFDDSVRETSEAVTMPPECYTSTDFWEFEKEAIFYREWLCLGRADQAQLLQREDLESVVETHHTEGPG